MKLAEVDIEYLRRTTIEETKEQAQKLGISKEELKQIVELELKELEGKTKGKLLEDTKEMKNIKAMKDTEIIEECIKTQEKVINLKVALYNIEYIECETAYCIEENLKYIQQLLGKESNRILKELENIKK